MSAYRGRTGPNYTEYLSSLNSASPLDEEAFNTDALDLGMFTNANFTHHDMIQEDNFNFDMNHDGNVKYQDLLAGEPDPQAFNPSTIDTSPNDAQFYSNYATPMQPAPVHGFPPLESQSPVAHAGPGAARRSIDAVQAQGITPDETSRVAAEEDKRRRNTAASARFRVKKKQREQALERNVKEVSDKNVKLEAKIGQLEMENKWLKDLITEKNAPIHSREELETKYMEFKRESEERDGAHTTGVGTE